MNLTKDNSIILIHQYYPERFFPVKRSDWKTCIAHNYSGLERPELPPLSRTDVSYLTPNIGKDIGGKMVLFEHLALSTWKPEFIALIHDKKSPQVHDGMRWRQELLTILSTDRKAQIEALFDDPKVGIVCYTGAFQRDNGDNQASLLGNNAEIIKDLLDRYNLRIPDYGFVAGTMFWARYEPYARFFQRHHPLSIRAELEPGPVTDHASGTYTHAWERLLSYIVTSQKLRIATVS